MSSEALSRPHPCFSLTGHHQHARVHLPVAPRCNLQCQYCRRSFDCVNESRPGVASTLLTPQQAAWYVDRLVAKLPNLSVVGIAGPGDPLANAEETFATLRLVHASHPGLSLCLSTNGLALEQHVADLLAVGVMHLTVTMNTIDPRIGEKLYRWVRDGEQVLSGISGARRLLDRQVAGISAAVRAGMAVKINCVLVPGLNAEHAPSVAKAVAKMGAVRFNPIPMAPVAGTPFEDLTPLDAKAVKAIADACADHLLVMRHCARCRADAVGILGHDDPSARNLLHEAATMKSSSNDRPYVAVASFEGALVNRHLGQCEKFLIYTMESEDFRLIDVRNAPESGTTDRWQKLGAVLSDCRAVVASGAGDPPTQALKETGLEVYTTEGLIADALELVYAGRGGDLRAPPCSSGCGGGKSGCGRGMGMCA